MLFVPHLQQFRWFCMGLYKCQCQQLEIKYIRNGLGNLGLVLVLSMSSVINVAETRERLVA